MALAFQLSGSFPFPCAQPRTRSRSRAPCQHPLLYLSLPLPLLYIAYVTYAYTLAAAIYAAFALRYRDMRAPHTFRHTRLLPVGALRAGSWRNTPLWTAIYRTGMVRALSRLSRKLCAAPLRILRRCCVRATRACFTKQQRGSGVRAFAFRRARRALVWRAAPLYCARPRGSAVPYLP